MMNMSKHYLLPILLLATRTILLLPGCCNAFEPHPTAIKHTCSSSDTPPGTLISTESDRGNTDDDGKIYVLLSPVSEDGILCTITRRNRIPSGTVEEIAMMEKTSVYIPIARSYKSILNPNGDGEWTINAGKYESYTSIECGTPSTTDTTNNYWTAGTYTCQLILPKLSSTNDGYYLSMFSLTSGGYNNLGYYSAADYTVLNDGTATDDAKMEVAKTLAARFLERTTAGPRDTEGEYL